MSFRPGDVRTPVGTLRLSVGALAEIADRLDAPDPGTLAARLRALDPDMARHLLSSLLRASGDGRSASERVARLSDAQIAARMPDMTGCIVAALTDGAL